jgi:hypothetical protein
MKSPSNPMIAIIQNSSWLTSGFLLATVVGIFAGMNGLKVGWLGALSAFAGLMLQSALTTWWVYWVMACILIAVALMAVTSVILKKRVIQDLISGIQAIRDGNPEDKELNTKLLVQHQNLDTRKVVIDVKGKMKKKACVEF